MICLSMAFIAAGGALFGGTFGVKAMSIFPEINGAAGAMMTAVRQILALELVTISEVMFDGTIVPVAKIIFGYAIVATMLYVIVFIKHHKRAKG